MEAMQVVRVVSRVSARESWTVLGEDDAPVAPVERFLAYLTDVERSPNTVKAYAHDLKDWFGASWLTGGWTGAKSASTTSVSSSPGCVAAAGPRRPARSG